MNIKLKQNGSAGDLARHNGASSILGIILCMKKQKALFQSTVITVMLLMEAFSCDQVSINPVTFTTCATEALLSLSVGHIVLSVALKGILTPS